MAQTKETSSETKTKCNAKKISPPDIRITVNGKPLPQNAVTVTRGKDGTGKSVRMTRTTISLRQEAAARFPPTFSYSPRVFIYGILAVALIFLTLELVDYGVKAGPWGDALEESVQKLFMTSPTEQGPDNIPSPQEEVSTDNLEKLQGNLDIGIKNEQGTFFDWMEDEDASVPKQKSVHEKSVEEGNQDKKEDSVPVPPKEKEHAYNSLEKEFEDKPEKTDATILGSDVVDGEKEDKGNAASKMKLVLINPKAENMLAPGNDRLKYTI